jgi:hypothetical protein
VFEINWLANLPNCKRGKTSGGMILRFSGGRESDSFWEWRRPKLDIPFTSERRVVAFGSAAARLMRTYATQVEVLRRLRNGGQQFVRVEHVHVNDGGQAMIGNVKKPDMDR